MLHRTGECPVIDKHIDWRAGCMRAARYTTDESKDKTLQVQVRRIKRDNVDPAPLNPASLPTVAATATSHTAGTRRRSETVTNAAATTGTTVGLALDINEL